MRDPPAGLVAVLRRKAIPDRDQERGADPPLVAE